MRKIAGLRTAAAVGLCFVLTGGALAQRQKVSEPEQQKWLRHLIPLPHEISIPEKLVIDCREISVGTRPNASDIEKAAASELEALFEAKTGAVPRGKGFDVLVGVADGSGKLCDKKIVGAERLRKLPNRDQAYVIQPVGENCLALAALDGKGVFHAMVTLRSLLEPVTTDTATEIPLMTVVDWPDFAERGLWNQNAEQILLDHGAAMKLNYARLVRTTLHRISKDGNHATLDVDLMRKGQLKAVNFVPTITHLNFLHRKGLYDVYPELKGRGDTAIAGQYHAHKEGRKEKQHRAPCASNPLLSRILAEWMTDLAAAGAPECSCWLTERPAQCACEECMREGQFVQEARAFVSAWKEVRKTHSGFGIRLFLSTTTNERYEKVLAGLPEGVRVERACAMDLERRRNEPRDIFVNERIDPLAAKGLWAATFDVPITANGKVETPEFKLPGSCACRIRDFLRQMGKRSYSGVYGMLAFSDSWKICGLNISALAEWSWNLNGRTEREFAAAWATRAGYENPDRVAEWSELMGQVEFDVYDSGFPECYAWGRAVDMVKHKRRPELGKGMFRYYRNQSSFDAKIAACRKAQILAKGFRDPYLANETAVVLSYVKLAQCVHRIATAVSSGADELALQKELARLKEAGSENVTAIRNWQKQLEPEPWHHRTYKAIKATEATVAGIQDALGEQ